RTSGSPPTLPIRITLFTPLLINTSLNVAIMFIKECMHCLLAPFDSALAALKHLRFYLHVPLITADGDSVMHRDCCVDHVNLRIIPRRYQFSRSIHRAISNLPCWQVEKAHVAPCLPFVILLPGLLRRQRKGKQTPCNLDINSFRPGGCYEIRFASDDSVAPSLGAFYLLQIHQKNIVVKLDGFILQHLPLLDALNVIQAAANAEQLLPDGFKKSRLRCF